MSLDYDLGTMTTTTFKPYEIIEVRFMCGLFFLACKNCSSGMIDVIT